MSDSCFDFFWTRPTILREDLSTTTARYSNSLFKDVSNVGHPELLCSDDVQSNVATKLSVYRIEQATYRTAAYASYLARQDSAQPGGDQMVLTSLR